MAPPKACGTVGNPCPQILDYPICKADDTSQAWIGLKRVMIIPPKAEGQPPNIKLLPLDDPSKVQPTDRNPTPDEVGKLVTEGWLPSVGYSGLCRSADLEGVLPKMWFAYRQHAGFAGKVSLFNEYNPGTHRTMDQTPFALTKDEAMGLVAALGLGIYDIACKEGMCPTEQPDGSFSEGQYFFTSDASRLGVMLKKLQNPSVKIEGMGDDIRGELMAHLTVLKAKADMPLANALLQGQFIQQNIADADERRWSGRLQLIFTLLLLVAIGYQPAKDVWKWWKGRVKMIDFGARIDARLKANSDYGILGRSREVKRAWRMADRPSFHSLIVAAKFGVGKDMVVDAMGIDRAKAGEAVPPQFRDAPWFEFTAAGYIADTGIRGNVGDKVREIIRLAEKGPVIIYVSEIDKVMLHGAAKDTRSEETGGLLLGELARPDIRKNIMLIGTTSRLAEMYATYPDLSRRFNILQLEEFTPSEIAKILDGVDPQTGAKGHRAIAETEAYYGVKISSEVLELAVRLCEKYYAPDRAFIDRQSGEYVFARFDTNLELLQMAGHIARDRGAKEMSAEDVIKAAEELTQRSIDRAEVDAVRAVDADSLMIMTSSKTNGTMSAELAREFRLNEMFKGIFAGASEGQVHEKAAEVAAKWEAVPLHERAMTIAKSGGRTVGGVPVMWILEQIYDGGNVCEAPTFDSAPVEGARSMMTEAPATVPPPVVKSPLEARIASMAAVTTDPQLRLVLERMTGDVATTEGQARAKAILTLLENPANSSRGIALARAFYEAPVEAPVGGGAKPAVPGVEGVGVAVGSPLGPEALKRALEVPLEVRAVEAVEAAKAVRPVEAKPVKPPIGKK